MSRFIDEFQKASRAGAPAMGFRTARSTAPAPKMLLIAELGQEVIKEPAVNLDVAHAALIRFTAAVTTAKVSQQVAASLPDIPWGFSLGDDDGKKAAALIKAGGDFMVFSAASQLNAVPDGEELGKVLQVESSMDDGLLRTVNEMPVHAVLVADTFEGGGSLVWHQLMIYQHLANFISKPLIVPVPASIVEAEVKILWDAGVDGVIAKWETIGAEGLKTLRQAVDNLPPRSVRKRGKAEALLPRLPDEARMEPPDEEEDE